MVCKRPFNDEDSEVVAFKHPRQQEHRAEQSSIMQISPCGYTLPKPLSGENSFSKAEEEKGIRRDSVNEDPNGAIKDLGVGASGRISSHFWVNNNPINQYSETDEAAYLSVFPNYFELDRRVWAFVQSDDVYTTLLEHSSRKPVPIGPDHQADVPDWVPQGSMNCSDYLNKSSDPCLVDDIDYPKKLMGTCVIPMPNLESPECGTFIGGFSGIKCECLDRGSIRCVRQHVREAKDEVQEYLGPIRFQELGLSDMGEEVAKKWSGEDEQAFDDVVLLNRASDGKNFWDHLSVIFPSRKKTDFVSYYFNVFILRKRAEQNRYDPLNIDSDDDEWQRSELEMTEDDDDGSVAESPVDQYGPVYNPENHEEEVETDACENDTNFVNHRDVTGDFRFDPVFQFSVKKSSNDREEYDFQDDSCTSFESQSERVDSCHRVDLETDGRVVVKSGHDK